MPIIPVTFGRDQDSGKYANNGSGTSGDSDKQIFNILSTISKNIKTGDDKIIALLEKMVHVGGSNNTSGTTRQQQIQANPLVGALNEKQSFTSGLGEAFGALSKGNLSGWEGVFSKIDKGLKVEVTNWPSDLANKEPTRVPLVTPIASLIGNLNPEHWIGNLKNLFGDKVLPVKVVNFADSGTGDSTGKKTAADAGIISRMIPLFETLKFAGKFFANDDDKTGPQWGAKKEEAKEAPKTVDNIFGQLAVIIENLSAILTTQTTADQLGVVIDHVSAILGIVATDQQKDDILTPLNELLTLIERATVATLQGLSILNAALESIEDGVGDSVDALEGIEETLERVEDVIAKSGGLNINQNASPSASASASPSASAAASSEFTLIIESIKVIVTGIAEIAKVLVEIKNIMAGWNFGSGGVGGAATVTTGGESEKGKPKTYKDDLGRYRKPTSEEQERDDREAEEAGTENRSQKRRRRQRERAAKSGQQAPAGGVPVDVLEPKLLTDQSGGKPVPVSKGETPPPDEGKKPDDKKRGGFADLGALGGIGAIGAALAGLVPMFAGLGPVITAVAGAFSLSIPVIATLGAVLLPVVVALAALAAAIVAVIGVFLILAIGVSYIIGAFSSLATGVMKAGTDLANGFNDVMSKFASGDFFGGIGAGANAVVKSFEDLSTGILGVIPLLGGTLSDVLKFFTGALQAGITAMTGFAQNMLPFVQALSPSTVEQFNKQMENLKATIGILFVNFIGNMAETIKKIGGILLPVMEDLKPVFDSLSRTLNSLILPAFKIFGALIAAMTGPLMQAMGSLRAIVLEVVKGMIILVASLAQLFGVGDFLDKLEEALDRPEGAGATAAGHASMSNFEAIAKDIAVAAAQASVSASSGADEDESVEDIMGEVRQILTDIRGEGIEQIINRIAIMIGEFWENLVAQFDEKWAAFSTWADTRLGPVFSAVMDRVWAAIQVWLNTRFPNATAVLPAVQNAIANPAEAAGDAARFYWNQLTGQGNAFGF